MSGLEGCHEVMEKQPGRGSPHLVTNHLLDLPGHPSLSTHFYPKVFVINMDLYQKEGSLMKTFFPEPSELELVAEAVAVVVLNLKMWVLLGSLNDWFLH